MTNLRAPADSWILFSLRRSRVRLRALRALGDLRSAYPAQIARVMGARLTDIPAILEGDSGEYREELSPVTLGLIDRIETVVGPLYEITPLGDQVLVILEADADEETLRAW